MGQLKQYYNCNTKSRLHHGEMLIPPPVKYTKELSMLKIAKSSKVPDLVRSSQIWSECVCFFAYAPMSFL